MDGRFTCLGNWENKLLPSLYIGLIVVTLNVKENNGSFFKLISTLYIKAVLVEKMTFFCLLNITLVNEVTFMSSYLKELYVFDDNKPTKAVIRNYKNSDIERLIGIQKVSFPPPFPSELWWNKEQLINHVTLFPEGTLCVEINGELCGSMTGLMINYTPGDSHHTWEEITSSGYITNHTPTGNTLYVVDICIKPSFRKFGLGKWLMQSMYETVVSLKLERLLGAGRLPGFHRYSKTMKIDTYVKEVLSGDLHDPVISFLLKCGRTPVEIIPNYLEDKESHNFGLLMEWRNPFHKKSL
jgi:ribosomal protein S18 acetylase RimI-like enzyme